MRIPKKAETICNISYLFIFSLKKKYASIADQIGNVKYIQLEVDTGINLTAATRPR